MALQPYNPLNILGRGVINSVKGLGAAVVGVGKGVYYGVANIFTLGKAGGRDSWDGLLSEERFHVFGTAHGNFGNLKVRAAEAVQSVAGVFTKEPPMQKFVDGLKDSAATLRQVKGKTGFIATAAHVTGNVAMMPVYGVAKVVKSFPKLSIVAGLYGGYKLMQRMAQNRDEKELANLQQANETLSNQIGQIANIRGQQLEMDNPLAEGKSANHFRSMVTSGQSQYVGR